MKILRVMDNNNNNNRRKKVITERQEKGGPDVIDDVLMYNVGTLNKNRYLISSLVLQDSGLVAWSSLFGSRRKKQVICKSVVSYISNQQVGTKKTYIIFC